MGVQAVVDGRIHIGSEDEAVRSEVEGVLEAAGITYESAWCGRGGCIPAICTVSLIGELGRVEGISCRSFAEAASKAAAQAIAAGWRS
jgi:hypothetical protein